MKIIKPGLDATPPTWQVTCGTCMAVLEYGRDDVRSDIRGGNYVICPNCKQWIAHSLGRRVDPIGKADEDIVTAYYNK
jgi:hypothetical protein